MSGFVMPGGSVDVLIDKCDYRHHAEWCRPDAELRDVGPAVGDLTPDNPWWPRSGGLVGDLANDVPMLKEAAYYMYPDITGGATSRFGFSGVTRDVYGSPLGGVTVKCFRTSTDEMVGSVISDVNTGAFFVTTPYYPDAHYLVTYKTGVPHIFGTTENTIVGG